MTVSRSALFAVLPPIWPHDVLPEIRTELAANIRQLVVLDDDGTGARGIYDTAVITSWDVGSLRTEFARRSRAFFILTNTRTMSGPAAQAVNLEIAQNLRAAARAEECTFTLVSRGDSMLRGHFPLETDTLAEICGPFDVTLLAPYLESAGRFTIANVHYAADGDLLRPVAETAFAADPAFGFRSSNLRAWIAEKCRGRLTAPVVRELSLETIRRGGPPMVLNALLNAPRGAHMVVNAAAPRDIAVVALATLQAELAGRQLLLRSGADLIAARLGFGPHPLLSGADLTDPGLRHGGLIVAGSYLPTATAQIERLRAVHPLRAIELDVRAILSPDGADRAVRAAVEDVNAALAAGEDALLFTSRNVASAADPEANLKLGGQVLRTLTTVVQSLSVRPRFVIAKGGTTASEVATRALGVKRAMVRGQLRPGIPVWQLGPETKYPGLNYVVVPSDMETPGTLADAVTQLRQA